MPPPSVQSTPKADFYAASISSIRDAADRIGPYAHRTPAVTSRALNELAGRSLFFKCENFQKVGAFKFRGACNAIMNLDKETAKRGVVTHSSGNHAQAVALAAKLRGIPAYIVMPNNASAIKRTAVDGYGGHVTECKPNQESREGTATRIVEESGGTMIPPYNHPDIISGQGTSALELIEEVRDLDAIITPIGGGGLISGTSIAARALLPNTKVFGSEPERADDAAQSLAAGKLIPQGNPQTIADGLLTSLGDLTWPIIHDHVHQIITVTEDEIVAAMRLVWERMKIVIEPSSAVAVAAVLTNDFKNLPKLTRVGVILSGGNVDLNHLPW